MDLDAQIARVAVLRTESRAAQDEAIRTAEIAEAADKKYRQASDELNEEIRQRINKLDPSAG